MKSAPALHCHDARPRDVAERGQLAGGEDGFHVRVAARFAEPAHFVVERLIVAGENVRARDHDVDLARTRHSRWRESLRRAVRSD